MLNLRSEASQFLKFEIGDWWHPNRVLFTQYGPRIVYDAKVPRVLKDKDWYWLPARSNALVEVQSKLSIVEIKSHDKSLSIPSKSGMFSSSKTLDQGTKRLNGTI